MHIDDFDWKKFSTKFISTYLSLLYLFEIVWKLFVFFSDFQNQPYEFPFYFQCFPSHYKRIEQNKLVNERGGCDLSD